jgi:site-specific DNA-methyltransferase (adenine-specific)
VSRTTITRRPKSRNPAYRITQADAIQWLSQLDTESVSLAITDPPYESLEKHRSRGTTTRLKQSKSSSNPWFEIFPNSRFEELFQELYRVLQRNSHLYVFCDPETAFIIKPIGERAGFKLWKPLIWDKQTIGMGYHYRARYEFILFFEKGRRRLNDLGTPDIISVPRIRGGYPAEKPSLVSKVLINQSSDPGELVIDPFTGSGSVGEAALATGRRFQGCDTNPLAIRYSRARLASVLRVLPRS